MKKTLKTFAALLALVLAIALSLVACDDPLGPDTGDSSPSVSDSSDTGSSDTGDVGSSDTGSDSSEQPAPKVTVPNRSEGQMIQDGMFDQLVYWFTTSEEDGKVIDMAYDPYYDEDGYAHFSYAYRNGASGAWGFQMFYINSNLNPGTSYRLSFDIDVLSENGGNITVNGKTVTLVKGENHVEVTYVEQAPALDGANATSLSSLDIQSGLTALEFTISPITDACWTESELDPQPDQTELFSSDEGYARSNPGVYVIWLDNGGQLTENKIDEEGIHFAYTTTSTQWYGVQLFYKNSTNVAGKKYKLSMTLTSNVEDDITVNGQVVHITAGANDIEVEYVEDEGNICSLDVQMGKDDDAHNDIVHAAEIDIANLSWEEVIPSLDDLSISDVALSSYNVNYLALTFNANVDVTLWNGDTTVTVNDKAATWIEGPMKEDAHYRINILRPEGVEAYGDYTIVVKFGEKECTLSAHIEGQGEVVPPTDLTIEYINIVTYNDNYFNLTVNANQDISIYNGKATVTVNDKAATWIEGPMKEDAHYRINILRPEGVEATGDYTIVITLGEKEYTVNAHIDAQGEVVPPVGGDYNVTLSNIEFDPGNKEIMILTLISDKDIGGSILDKQVTVNNVECDLIECVHTTDNNYTAKLFFREKKVPEYEISFKIGGQVIATVNGHCDVEEEIVDPVPDELAVEFVEAKTYSGNYFRLVVRSASDLVSLKNVTITVDGYAVTVAIDGPMAWGDGNTAYQFMKPDEVAETVGQHTIVLKIGEKEFTFENVTVVAE